MSDEEYDELAEKAIRTRQDLDEIIYGKPFETDANDIITVDIRSGITSIGDMAFMNCTALETVYYAGTEATRNSMAIGDYNECLINAE